MTETTAKARRGMITIRHNMRLSFWVHPNGIVLAGGRGAATAKSGRQGKDTLAD
ncbi:hypothetical protein [Paracoccus shanxieyensis]|uniref:Uncharacterized protein n=1 Tax=Paracoccus shanxieyensis TaxID=2675752 RepID=A0A6L6J4X1_9RHOB|nr:hypothetical protein [Paracoccus shanxieyensis]MTH65764.1 hypothetical protein [Paracoccus shanxieyensis]MTH88861.1 hypothetical protein [Paracoccus shanxieyensis]